MAVEDLAGLVETTHINTARPQPQSELIIFFARSVGLLVAVVAIIFTIMIMMFLRSVIAIIISKWGILTPAVLTATILFALLKILKVSPRVGWTMLTRACS